MSAFLPLVLTDETLPVITIDAEVEYPDECCGFLYGHETATERVVTEAVPVANKSQDNKKRRFAVSPQDYLAAERYALQHGLTLLGVFHSHPDHPAQPSETDLKFAQPYFSYIIVSVRKGLPVHLTSWQIGAQGTFEPETVVLPAEYDHLSTPLL